MDTIERDGYAFKVEHVPDDDAGAPWDNQDLLGTVSDWERRDKRPSERILNSDRGSKRFYDFAAAVRRARKEGYTGRDAADAAEREYNYLRAWCNDQWSYIGVVVTLLDDEGNETDNSDALWGIESDSQSCYMDEVAQDCAYNILAYVAKSMYAGSTVGMM